MVILYIATANPSGRSGRAAGRSWRGTRETRESVVADSPATNKMSEAITRTLPFLRRYARAVTGSQKRGDEWVRLCAEVVMAQPDLITKAEDTKLAGFTFVSRRPAHFQNS